MTSFWKAFLWVAIPIIAFSLLSTSGDVNTSPLAYLWFGAAAIAIVALFVMVDAAIRGRGQRALGILAALAVGSVALALTCISNLAGIEF